MRLVILLGVFCCLLTVGCEYEVPVTAEHSIRVDPAVLGLWESLPEGGQEKERLVVLKYSDTEYLVHYPAGTNGFYFRAYAIKLDGLSAVQLELLGAGTGPAPEDVRKYHVVAYTLQNGVLEIKTLNTDKVDKDIKTSKALQEAILKHKADKDLFGEPGRFKKLEPK